MNDRIHIIGIGSPFGDDRLGWVAAEMLQRSDALHAIGRITVSLLDRPGTVLLARWQDAQSVIILDAVSSGARPGTRHRLDAGELAARHPASCHGFGVANALDLARVLGDLPPRLFLRGIELDPSWGGVSTVSDAVARALPLFVRETEELALVLACQPGPARKTVN